MEARAVDEAEWQAFWFRLVDVVPCCGQRVAPEVDAIGGGIGYDETPSNP